MNTLSIIVPVYNEACMLPQAIQHLQNWDNKTGCEVIIVDGGSSDGSIEILRKSGIQTVYSCKGRALQMNTGAAVAKGDVLLFLHIDTQLPDDADQLIADHAQNPVFAWGRFDVRIDSRHWLLALVSDMINWRSRLSGITTGDQAIFIRADIFRQIGGYTEQPLMEDIDISRRLLELSDPVCLKQKVITSARRWQKHGIVCTILLMWRLRYLYWRGVPATDLAREYS